MHFDLFVGLKIKLMQYEENISKTLYIHYYLKGSEQERPLDFLAIFESVQK